MRVTRKTKHPGPKRTRNPKQEVLLLAALSLTVLIVFSLFVNPIIGMADNGDFFREIHNLGIYYLTDSFDERHFGYFNKLYGIRQYPFDQNTIFVSSLSLLIRVALSLDLWVTMDNLFDLQTLAVLYTVIFVAAFYMLLKRVSEHVALPVLAVTAVIAIGIFGDIGYIAYFNSFYGEPASYVFLFLTLAFLFRLLSKEKPSMGDFFAFFISALIFVGAKQQNAPVGVFMAALCLRFLLLRKDKPWRILIISAVTAILAVSAFVYGSMTDDISHINQYHAVTRGILENSKNPERDVEELGLDKKFSLLAHTTYYDKYTLEKSESALLNEEFYPKYGYGTIIKYYVLHPDRAFEKLDIAARHAYSIRPEVIGNYEKEAGKGYGKKTDFFSAWSSLKAIVFPKSFKFIVFFYALYYGGLMKFYIGRFKDSDYRGMIRMEAFGLMGLIGLLQFSVSFLGAGDADMAKHLFLFNVCFDFMFFAMVIYVINQFYVKWGIGMGQKAGGFRWKQKKSISG